MGLEPTSESGSPPVFKQRSTTAALRLHPPYRSAAGFAYGRMTSVVKLRELESNQRLRGQSPASLPAATIPQWMSVEGHNSHGKVRELRGQDLNLRSRGQSHEFLPAETSPQWEEGRTTEAAVPGLEPTRGCLTNTCSAAELPTRIAKTTAARRLHPRYLSAAGLASSRMTSIDSSCGDRNRTCVTTVNSRLPVPARTPPQCHPVSVVGTEPTPSCDRSTRRVHVEHGPGVHRGPTSVDGKVHPRERKSTQWESNPHLRPGETVRCRYVIGAVSPGRIVKEQIAAAVNARAPSVRSRIKIAREKAPGGTRTHVAALRVRCLGR